MSWDEWCDEDCYSWLMSMVLSSVVVVVAGDFVGVTVGLVSSVVDGALPSVGGWFELVLRFGGL